MRILLDTCAFLWAISGDPRLPASARDLVVDRSHEVLVSAVTSWEIAIKVGLGKLEVDGPPAMVVPAELKRHGYAPLEITHSHALHVAELPQHHRDPFDRLLVAQCQLESTSLLSPDEAFRSYEVDVLW